MPASHPLCYSATLTFFHTSKVKMSLHTCRSPSLDCPSVCFSACKTPCPQCRSNIICARLFSHTPPELLPLSWLSRLVPTSNRHCFSLPPPLDWDLKNRDLLIISKLPGKGLATVTTKRGLALPELGILIVETNPET